MWTETDYQALSRAMAQGLKRVRYGAGNEIEYQTLEEMRTLKRDMETALGLGPNGQPVGAGSFDYTVGVVDVRY